MLISVMKKGKMRIIRFPEQLGEVCDIPDSMELLVLEKGIVLSPRVAGLRDGWQKKYAIMHDRGEDSPLLHERD